MDKGKQINEFPDVSYLDFYASLPSEKILFPVNKLVDQLFNIIVIVAVIIICVIVFRKAKDVFSGKESIVRYEEEEAGDLSYDGIEYDDAYDDDYYYDELEEDESESAWQYDDREGNILEEKPEDEIGEIMDEIVNEKPKPAAVRPEPAEDVQPKASPEPTKPRPAPSSGDFLLIAGSFTTHANAEIFVKDLEKKGYTPQIIQFPNSGNFHVSAASFSNKDDAKMEMNRLKNVHKVDCYVRVRK